jgi:hypothetical protein
MEIDCLKVIPEKFTVVSDCCVWLNVKGKEIRQDTSKFNVDEIQAITALLHPNSDAKLLNGNHENNLTQSLRVKLYPTLSAAPIWET